jgi:NAD-reducing hydrogenase large subunit
MTSNASLETATPVTGLRRVAIDPLSRVEGHGKVTILLDAEDRVHQVRLHIVEFRGFEKFIQGRPYWEVPVMVQRLCGICPVSHHIAASKAMDRIIGVTALTPAAEKLRRLMHYGQILQSHALHFFLLASPDLLFGFDAEPQRRNVVALAAAHPDIARQGILLRKYGQEVIRFTAGKRVHGTGSVPGGVNKALAPAERAELQRDIGQMVAWSREAVGLAKMLHRSHRAIYDSFGACESNYLSLVRADGAMDLYDGVLRARDASGAIIFDGIEDQGYAGVIFEQVKPWSYMKFPFIASLGPQRGWYKVGPLARVQNCDFIPTPLAEAERQEFVSYGDGHPVHAPLAYHWTRMIEMLHAAETILRLLQDDDLAGSDLIRSGHRRPEGVGVIEAPRGTLIHHYRVGEDDLVTQCNLIVSTTHNNQPMNEAIREVARRYLSGRKVTEALLNHVEVAIRAFDPCLSCATHALGRMPLELGLVDARGELLDRIVRDADGACRRP